jgi:predicted GNAT family acetyltransferase
MLFKSPDSAVKRIATKLQDEDMETFTVILNEDDEIIGILIYYIDKFPSHFYFKSLRLLIVDILDYFVLCDVNPGDLYIAEIAIDSSLRGQGLGRKVLDEVILDQLKLKADIYKSINTSNIDIKGENVKLMIKKEQEEINVFKDKIKEINLKKGKEEVEKKGENENLINEIKNKNENFIKRQEEINNKINKYGIYVDKLDGIETNTKSNLAFIITEVAGGVLTFGGLLLTAILPEVGPIISLAGLGMMTGGGLKKIQEP